MHAELTTLTDSMPVIGAKVKIHITRPDTWIEHTVVGYYTITDVTTGATTIFVRVMDTAGFLTAREINQIKC